MTIILFQTYDLPLGDVSTGLRVQNVTSANSRQNKNKNREHFLHIKLKPQHKNVDHKI